MGNEKTKTVYNRSVRRYRITNLKDPKKPAWLEPGDTAEVLETEAVKLLQYDGIIDPAKLAKTKTAEDYEVTIQGLKNKVEELEAKIKALISDGKEKESEDKPKSKKKGE